MSREADLIIHADWGSDPKKRWMCVARRAGSSYEVKAPEPVGALDTLWRRIAARADGGSAVVGFDFPIGLPRSYAYSAGISSFVDALRRFGEGEWQQFYELAEQPSQISLHRPFYPFRPGGTKRAHLIEGLALSDGSELLRRCERKTENRGPASPMFWTLGGKQVGRAAIIGWRDLIAPGLADESLQLKIWPFHGSIKDLVGLDTVVVAETYPAEACLHLGLAPPGGQWAKTSQQGRQSQAVGLFSWAQRRRIALAEKLVTLIREGFGPDKSAEDPFDAVLGALSMLEVTLGFRPEGDPSDIAVRQIEGWILGQEA